MSAYLDDIRIKLLLDLVTKYRSARRSPHTNKVPKDTEEFAEEARKAIHSIGKQMETVYHEQLPLVEGVEPRKAVQGSWKKKSSGTTSKSGTKPTTPFD